MRLRSLVVNLDAPNGEQKAKKSLKCCYNDAIHLYCITVCYSCRYQSIIRQYEDKQRDLVTLVDSLRQVLFDTDTELSQILSLSPCQPTHATSTLGSEDEWGPVLKVKFEALRERVKGLAGSGEDPQVVLDHSFSADDSVLNSINANI